MARPDAALVGMVLIRFLSSMIEFSAALLMIRMGTVQNAVRINAALGLVGQAVLITASLVGIAGLAGQISWPKTLMVLTGVCFVLLGTR